MVALRYEETGDQAKKFKIPDFSGFFTAFFPGSDTAK